MTDLGAEIARQHHARQAERLRALNEDANRLCGFCKGANVMTCTCGSDCGHRGCGRQRESGMPADWLWNPRALARVPRFNHCPTWKILRGVD